MKPMWFLEGAILPFIWCYILGFLQCSKGRWKMIYLESSSLITSAIPQLKQQPQQTLLWCRKQKQEAVLQHQWKLGAKKMEADSSWMCAPKGQEATGVCCKSQLKKGEGAFPWSRSSPEQPDLVLKLVLFRAESFPAVFIIGTVCRPTGCWRGGWIAHTLLWISVRYSVRLIKILCCHQKQTQHWTPKRSGTTRFSSPAAVIPSWALCNSASFLSANTAALKIANTHGIWCRNVVFSDTNIKNQNAKFIFKNKSLS